MGGLKKKYWNDLGIAFQIFKFKSFLRTAVNNLHKS